MLILYLYFMRYSLFLILFLCSSCATLSSKDIDSGEYGLVLYKVINAGPGYAYVDMGNHFLLGTAGKNPDPKLSPPSHRNLSWKDSEDYYYGFQYAKPGIYPIQLVNSYGYSMLYGTHEYAFLPNLGCVEVQAGVINYIGDYYWSIGSKENFQYESFLSYFTDEKTAKTSLMVKNNFRAAQRFMHQYYQEYNFPVVNSPLFKNCH